MATAKHARDLPRMTYEEFLDWADEDTLAEWVDGEIEMASPASARHQQIKVFLMRVLSSFVELRQLGIMMDAPFQMKLPQSGREPDVLFIAAPHTNRLMKAHLDGPADLVVEIVSPESVERDRVKKFAEYQAGKVSEYWLIDPDAETVEFYQLDDQGAYQPMLPAADGRYHSRALPGFWLQVEWLWQDPPPPINAVLLEICGDDYARAMLDELKRGGFLPPDGTSQQS